MGMKQSSPGNSSRNYMIVESLVQEQSQTQGSAALQQIKERVDKVLRGYKKENTQLKKQVEELQIENKMLNFLIVKQKVKDLES